MLNPPIHSTLCCLPPKTDVNTEWTRNRYLAMHRGSSNDILQKVNIGAFAFQRGYFEDWQNPDYTMSAYRQHGGIYATLGYSCSDDEGAKGQGCATGNRTSTPRNIWNPDTVHAFSPFPFTVRGTFKQSNLGACTRCVLDCTQLTHCCNARTHPVIISVRHANVN
jgi:hypothetical protein